MAARVLGDRYEIEGPLGRGGMAEVYLATDRVLGRRIAVKVLSRRFADDDRFVTRFRREAQAAAGLNHPNVVSVYDTGSQNGVHYIVMEFVEGLTLADLLRRDGPVAPERAVEIGAGIADALEAAHRTGLVHRDVKPGNVMIAPDGRVKVMDFGIARAAADETLTQTGIVLGTTSYLPPEQVRGDHVDARSDVYAVGCVLYEMLTGRPPFTADSPMAVAYQHIHERPDRPSTVHPGVPPAVEAVVMRALEKDPNRRFRSGRDLRDALVAAAGAQKPTVPLAAPGGGGGSGGDTEVLPAAKPEAPPSARRWASAAILALLILALGGAALMALTRENPGEARLPAPETTAPPAAPSPSITEEPSPPPTPEETSTETPAETPKEKDKEKEDSKGGGGPGKSNPQGKARGHNK